VTGANTGIGFHIARQLAEAGLTVYVGSRDAERGQAAVDEIGERARLLVLDVTDAASISAAVGAVDALDILVNNAGIGDDLRSAPETEPDSFRRIFETNVVGVVAVTNAFLPLLRSSAEARIVNISSGTGSLTRASGGGGRAGSLAASKGGAAAYRSSKTALNALTVFYAQALADDGIKVNSLAPGLRATGLNAMASASDADPAEGAAGAVWLAMLPEDGPTGGFFSFDGSTIPW
jgi:NAD(P)-dependent dehydrogenase (short-subunit alcohol dehydrogenase family)